MPITTNNLKESKHTNFTIFLYFVAALLAPLGIGVLLFIFLIIMSLVDDENW